MNFASEKNVCARARAEFSDYKNEIKIVDCSAGMCVCG